MMSNKDIHNKKKEWKKWRKNDLCLERPGPNAMEDKIV